MISIIALLVAILLPVIASARYSAQAVLCMTNQRQIYVGLAAYATDYHGYIPNGSPMRNPRNASSVISFHDVLVMNGYISVPFTSAFTSDYVVTHHVNNPVLGSAGVFRCPSALDDRGPIISGNSAAAARPRGYGPIQGRWTFFPFNPALPNSQQPNPFIQLDQNNKINVFYPYQRPAAWTLMGEGRPLQIVASNLGGVYTGLYPRHGAGFEYTNYLFSDGHVETLHYDTYRGTNTHP